MANVLPRMAAQFRPCHEADNDACRQAHQSELKADTKTLWNRDVRITVHENEA
jgi:hypothetical protein